MLQQALYNPWASESRNFSNPLNNMIQERRPHIQLSWVELKNYADSQCRDIECLQEVISELKYRKSKSAVALYKKLAARLTNLTEENTPSFRWPTTAVVGDSSSALRIAHFDYDEGLLKFMGYTVGQNGAYRTRRRQVLDYVFNEKVPKVQSYEYMAEWGEPKTTTRLQKLANSLATFARNAKRRRSSDMDHAVAEWEEDLQYIKESYYDTQHEFPWPSITE